MQKTNYLARYNHAKLIMQCDIGVALASMAIDLCKSDQASRVLIPIIVTDVTDIIELAFSTGTVLEFLSECPTVMSIYGDVHKMSKKIKDVKLKEEISHVMVLFREQVQRILRLVKSLGQNLLDKREIKRGKRQGVKSLVPDHFSRRVRQLARVAATYDHLNSEMLNAIGRAIRSETEQGRAPHLGAHFNAIVEDNFHHMGLD